MTTIPTTQKAIIVHSFPGAATLSERPVPRQVGDGEILVKILATALNPMDSAVANRPWAFVQIFPDAPKEETPLVIGEDFAGEVVSVGSSVTAFAVGDLVFAPSSLGANDTQAHQQYAKVPARLATKIPQGVTPDGASTVPMAFTTAATGLYFSGGLVAPWKGGVGHYAGKPIVVLGASSSVGQFTVQLARLSGFSPIITTASSQHKDYLTTLGATHVLPYSTSPSDLQSIAQKPIEVVFIAVTTEENIPPAVETVSTGGTLILTMPQLLGVANPLAEAKSVKAVTMFASPYAKHVEAFGIEMYEALEGLLARGDIVPNRVQIVEGGLAGIPEALNLFTQKQVSGVKLVARPQETA